MCVCAPTLQQRFCRRWHLHAARGAHGVTSVWLRQAGGRGDAAPGPDAMAVTCQMCSPASARGPDPRSQFHAERGWRCGRCPAGLGARRYDYPQPREVIHGRVPVSYFACSRTPQAVAVRVPQHGCRQHADVRPRAQSAASGGSLAHGEHRDLLEGRHPQRQQQHRRRVLPEEQRRHLRLAALVHHRHRLRATWQRSRASLGSIRMRLGRRTTSRLLSLRRAPGLEKHEPGKNRQWQRWITVRLCGGSRINLHGC